MRRRLVLLVFTFMTCAVMAFAAEEGETHGGDPFTMWKWVNFGILAAGLAFLAVKYAGPAFRARGSVIRKELDTARQVKSESEAKVAEIERKLGNLSAEIEHFRHESKEMIARESEKISRETAQLLERANSQTEHEIAALTKAATNEVRAEAARLALKLAGQRLAQGIPPETQAGLVSGFVEELKKVRA